VGDLRKRWSSAMVDAAAGSHWRDFVGSSSRQLLRNLDHTEAVHGFLAALAEQARSSGWELTQLDPPQRASRYFRFEDRLRSIQPDAFGVLRSDGRIRSFFLEWERRAIRPSTMMRRLAPYLRYHLSRRTLEDHSAPPMVLVAFEDELASDHFCNLARDEMQRSRAEIQLLISSRPLLGTQGPWDYVWRTPLFSRAVNLLGARRGAADRSDAIRETMPASTASQYDAPRLSRS